jgi:hypothetical protein
MRQNPEYYDNQQHSARHDLEMLPQLDTVQGVKAGVTTCRTSLSDRTRYIIWAQAAGRCQYPGCNKSLIGDLISGSENRNFGFVAHIVAERPTGPRGDVVRSALLADDVRNLMLLCYVHHKLIDVDDVGSHPEARLLAMKAMHERRIDTVGAIHEDRASHVLRYGATIGSHESPIAYEHISCAMVPDRYPAEGRHTIDIELRGADHQDHEGEYWDFQFATLRRQYERKVKSRIGARDIRHLSVFALAPQPLLIELGRLLGDITPAGIFQLHREPSGWKWPSEGRVASFGLRRAPRGPGPTALVLALSATINDERVASALGKHVKVWAIEALEFHNDMMQRQDDLAEFRRLLRLMFNEIKAVQGEDARIHVFPAVPVSAAVEVGRVWMPKADLPLVVYDQNRLSGGFKPVLRIGGNQ